MNKFKLKIVNNLLTIANKILTKKYMPFDNFELFDEDDLPTNSDVVVIISNFRLGNCIGLDKKNRKIKGLSHFFT